ncbi:HAMP domain-containing histidine kinase [Nocardioides sp. IC4_145]|uniref:sensor histidine kinase n=1 Tax=Nocardioides sp. IC4_145 TaxID=2714037 RepID=UPI00140AD74B|nr:HAMP domain-containing sensor histidine kinase [Nocardioides sp. IC4_145]NHC24105.1 HAMP domain-containing histidine kinase [Nocardioides sp. IC4_145]
MPGRGGTGRPWAGALRGVLLASTTDPRAIQGGFALLVAVDVALRLVGGVRVGLSAPAVAVLAVLVLLAVTLVAHGRMSMRAVEALLVADIAVVGIARLSPEGGSGLLVVLPALWLGRLLGRRGAAVAGVATVALVTVPGLAYTGADGIFLSRSVIIPVVATIAALAIAGGMEQVGQAMETVEHQRRVSEATLDTVDVGLVLLDRDGKYVAINRRHEDFMALAYPGGHAGRAGQVGHVLDADRSTLLPRESMPTYRAAQGEEFDDCRIWAGDDPLTQRALSVSARSVRDEAGRFAGAALAYKDVTDFMRAMEVKDEFVASVSHELRTPLTSIVGYVQMLREDDGLGPRAARQLEVVDRNAQRLLRLITDLLDTAQIDAGPVGMARTPCDLAGLLRDCVDAARPAYRAAGIRLDLTAPPALPMLLDRQRIEQVVDNLLTNAMKYSTSGTEVCVSLAVEDGRAELTVADQGIGISAADRDRLFTRFFRSRDAEDRSIQGVGLGLSITRGIVEAHGGRIEVDSELGVGSTFRVRLPIEVAGAFAG